MRDPLLYFVQRLRDEAHRFAIGSHRARRKKEMTRNPLDEIAGIGPGPQAGAAARLRHRQGGEQCGDGRPDGGGGHFESVAKALFTIISTKADPATIACSNSGRRGAPIGRAGKPDRFRDAHRALRVVQSARISS